MGKSGEHPGEYGLEVKETNAENMKNRVVHKRVVLEGKGLRQSSRPVASPSQQRQQKRRCHADYGCEGDLQSGLSYTKGKPSSA